MKKIYRPSLRAGSIAEFFANEVDAYPREDTSPTMVIFPTVEEAIAESRRRIAPLLPAEEEPR